jgi:hypothetical protein
MRRLLFRYLRLEGDARAVAKGPKAVGRRLVRRKAHKGLSRALGRLLK